MENKIWGSFILCLSLILSASVALAVPSIYCPTNHAYISVGMTKDQVISACGKPTRKEESKEPYKKKIPMMQLMYNSRGTQQAFYGVWTIPVGVTTGSSLEVDVVDNKVYSVQVNGEQSKAFSICKGIPITKGEPVSNVYNACGNPSTLNNTYIEKVEPNAPYPETWYYTFPYQDSIRVTFVNDKLIGIN
ncbi:MAG: hypothetical protein A3F18_07670 [Legionellales bacterium RIFCSPHIGHO2_12_FULL_37_14]|nr:MAG: hypothetical protein A3F18_07670 [Legionellales bacterium RIFCSPHIGHO2_12_FULL_37_14]